MLTVPWQSPPVLYSLSNNGREIKFRENRYCARESESQRKRGREGELESENNALKLVSSNSYTRCRDTYAVLLHHLVLFSLFLAPFVNDVWAVLSISIYISPSACLCLMSKMYNCVHDV